jgi:hypothetical protein
MGDSIDDAFDAADREAAKNQRAEQQEKHNSAVYEAQVEPLVRSLVDAVRQKAEEFNNHPKNFDKAAVMPAGTQITIRRASATGIPDRRIEVGFRRDLAELSWKYEVSPNPVYAEYEVVDSGVHGFHVHGDTLQVQGVGSPADFGEMVLGQYIRDCASDTSRRQEN